MQSLAYASQVIALSLLLIGPALASDGYVYNAPQTTAPLVINGELNDWPDDSVLPWELMARTFSPGGTRRDGDADFTGAFKMMWGRAIALKVEFYHVVMLILAILCKFSPFLVLRSGFVWLNRLRVSSII